MAKKRKGGSGSGFNGGRLQRPDPRDREAVAVSVDRATGRTRPLSVLGNPTRNQRAPERLRQQQLVAADEWARPPAREARPKDRAANRRGLLPQRVEEPLERGPKGGCKKRPAGTRGGGNSRPFVPWCKKS